MLKFKGLYHTKLWPFKIDECGRPLWSHMLTITRKYVQMMVIKCSIREIFLSLTNTGIEVSN